MGDFIEFLVELLIAWHILMGVGMFMGAIIYTVKVDIIDMWRKSRRIQRYAKKDR